MNKNMKGMALHIEEQIEMDFDAFLRSFNQNKDCSFAFLLGAGASITSGVQSAEDCIWDWKRLIYISKILQKNLLSTSILIHVGKSPSMD